MSEAIETWNSPGQQGSFELPETLVAYFQMVRDRLSVHARVCTALDLNRMQGILPLMIFLLNGPILDSCLTGVADKAARGCAASAACVRWSQCSPCAHLAGRWIVSKRLHASTLLYFVFRGHKTRQRLHCFMPWHRIIAVHMPAGDGIGCRARQGPHGRAVG